MVTDYLSKQVLSTLRRQSGFDRGQILAAFVDQWDTYLIFATMMNRTFDYLNRYYLRNNAQKSIGEQCKR